MAEKKPYKFARCRHILTSIHDLYHKQWKKLGEAQLDTVEEHLQGLDQALLAQDREKADQHARLLEDFGKHYFGKSFFAHARDLVIALVLAIIIATVVRQVWFEHYEVPTGSMRPTLEELDHLVVAKTDFGVNVPLMPKQAYFDPSLVQRLGIVVFTVEGMDFQDGDTTYFYLFPSKKRLIKRLIGKPGDALYFYGGQIYGVDSDGNDIPDLRESPLLANLEYIPFLRIHGELKMSSSSKRGMPLESTMNLMNTPLAQFGWDEKGKLVTQVFHPQADNVSQVWGIGNYAMARVMTAEQAMRFSQADKRKLPEAEYYMELVHSPGKSEPRLVVESTGKTLAMASTEYTLIPLHKKHLQRLWSNLYTTRFVVKDGRVGEYNYLGTRIDEQSPEMAGVEDGTYELYYGKAYGIGWGGMRTELPEEHPLNTYSVERLQSLYNMGIHFRTMYDPGTGSGYFPNRYAYFKDGELHALGGTLMERDDPHLVAAMEREQKLSVPLLAWDEGYQPFVDEGPPLLEDGSIDKEHVLRYGLKVPPGNYFVLGDNHAVSGDSRVFGFVPQQNLRGAPSSIIWPLGERWGGLNQPPRGWFTVPQLLIWGVVFGIVGWTWFQYSRPHKKAIFRKVKRK